MTSAHIPPAPALLQADWWSLWFREMLSLEEASILLDDMHTERVMQLVEEGRLRGVNIALKTETRREVRVWRYSVQWLAEVRRRKCQRPPAPLVDQLIPIQRRNLHCKEVADLLACSERHVRNLRLDGPELSAHHHRVTRAALVQFLRDREINAA